jgi:large subunit ribosomal protein L18
MDRLVNKTKHRDLRAHRVRARLTGTATRPRLSVHISNHHVSAQLIDDIASRTLAQASTVGQKTSSDTLTVKAERVGAEIAEKANTAKISSVVFDRGPKLYHGRVKALADAAREKGLKF